MERSIDSRSGTVRNGGRELIHYGGRKVLPYKRAESGERIQTDKLERQKQEDKQQTQRIEEEKTKQPLKKKTTNAAIKTQKEGFNASADPRAGDAIFRCHPILLRRPHLNRLAR
jgi:hypothetical protein